MKIIFVFSLLGAFAHQVVTLEEPRKAFVSVWPQGSTIYLGESVLLQCSVESNSSFAWSYRWYRSKTTPNPRHLVSGDRYSITAVTREDAGGYWCTAEQRESNTSTMLLRSQPAVLIVSDRSAPSLTVTPSSRLVFRGERVSVRCPGPQTNSTTWTLKHLPPGQTRKAIHAEQCSPGEGAAATGNTSDMCVFSAASSNSGLYWCEGAENRSNAVNITVSYGNMILKVPASSVLVGDKVSLYCQYAKGKHNETIFFKNGEILTSSSADRETKMIIPNVTLQHEGFYKCASQDRRMESPESWLSVRPGRGNHKSADGTAGLTGGSLKWAGVTCVALFLCLVPVMVWLVLHRRYQTVCTRSCWPLSIENVAAVGLPATKQDVTEVQWDLSWMEIDNLLDKQPYPGT